MRGVVRRTRRQEQMRDTSLCDDQARFKTLRAAAQVKARHAPTTDELFFIDSLHHPKQGLRHIGVIRWRGTRSGISFERRVKEPHAGASKRGD